MSQESSHDLLDPLPRIFLDDLGGGMGSWREIQEGRDVCICRNRKWPLFHKAKPKNTGVGSLSFLQQIFLTQESNWSLLHCRRILYQLSYQGRPKICESHSVVSNSLQLHELYIYSPWNSPGQNMGMGSIFLLQWVFPTQGLNRGLLHCRQVLYQLSHKGSPRTLEWVVYPFSTGSSRPRNCTGVSCIAGGFFTN